MFENSIGDVSIRGLNLKSHHVFKGWVNAAPRLQHEEMEEFLRYKEREARLKSLKSEQR